MKKKLFSMLLAAILMSGTVACNRTDTETTPFETQNNTETDETETVEVESKRKLQYQIAIVFKNVTNQSSTS